MLGPWKKIGPASEYLNVSERKLRDWISRGMIQHRRIDGVLYFATEWLDEFMLNGTQDTPQVEKVNAIVDSVMKDFN
jgi:hypothetical protein